MYVEIFWFMGHVGNSEKGARKTATLVPCSSICSRLVNCSRNAVQPLQPVLPDLPCGSPPRDRNISDFGTPKTLERVKPLEDVASHEKSQP